MCVTNVEAGGGLISAFALGSGNQGAGNFEVCAVDVSLDNCTDDFISSPDGNLEVTAGVQISGDLMDGLRYPTDDSAYLEYYKQGVSQEPNALASQFDISESDFGELLRILRNQ